MFINDQCSSDDEELGAVQPAFQDFDHDAEEERRTSAYDSLLQKVLENSRNTLDVYHVRSESIEEQAERLKDIMRKPTVDDLSVFRVACKVG